MATAEPTTHRPLVPPMSKEERHRRNMEAIRLIEDWDRNGDEQEQRESMEILIKALGPDRTMSCRDAFP